MERLNLGWVISMGDVVVRKGTEDDLVPCYEMSKHIPVFVTLNTAKKVDAIEHLKGYLEKGIFIVAADSGDAIGYLQAEVTTGNILYVDKVFVRESHHRKGIGRMLMGALKDHGKELGLSTLTLFAESKDDKAISFYESLGMSKEKLYYEFLEKF